MNRKIWVNFLALIIILVQLVPKFDAENVDQQVQNSEHVTARLTTGEIRGRVSYLAGKHKPVHVFQGIPFAEPPVGNLRWRQLVPKKPWDGILNATRYSPACPSNTTETTSPEKNISEDCIYANVFAGPDCQATPCPVLFYIHGGAFRYSSAIRLNESQIVQKYASDSVIFVNAAYRLGVFGFLDLDDENVTKRNLGLYDILFALHWVKREFPAAFGADPNRITIIGNSAGGTAVIHLCSSPLVSSNDFHQAVIMSGQFNYPSSSPNLRPSLAIAKFFNCSSTSNRNKSEVLTCLQNVPTMDLLQYQRQIESELSDDGHTKLIFKGPSKDGLLLQGDNAIEQLEHWKPRSLLITTTLHEFRNRGLNEADECSNAISTFGLETKEVFQSCLDRYHNEFVSKINVPIGTRYEVIHANAILLAALNKNHGGSSYVASFELTNFTAHAEDMYFFLGFHWKPVSSPAEELMDLYYPTFLKNFVRSGIPDPAWRKVDSMGRNYYVLDFKVAPNGSETYYPRLVAHNYSDTAAFDFWLRKMPRLEVSGWKSLNANESHTNLKLLNLFKMFADNKSPFLDEANQDQNSNFLPDGEDNFGQLSNNRHRYRHHLRKLNRVWGLIWITIYLAMLVLLVLLVVLFSRIIFCPRSGYSNISRWNSAEDYAEKLLTEYSPIMRAKSQHSQLPKYSSLASTSEQHK